MICSQADICLFLFLVCLSVCCCVSNGCVFSLAVDDGSDAAAAAALQRQPQRKQAPAVVVKVPLLLLTVFICVLMCVFVCVLFFSCILIPSRRHPLSKAPQQQQPLPPMMTYLPCLQNPLLQPPLQQQRAKVRVQPRAQYPIWTISRGTFSSSSSRRAVAVGCLTEVECTKLTRMQQNYFRHKTCRDRRHDCCNIFNQA